jgi:FSR family fosmidomycin resistance protein-like MFS transporter
MNGIANGKSALNLKVLLVLSFGHLATDMCQSALPAILPFLKAKLLLSYTMSGVILMASNITSSVIQPLFGYFSDKKEKALLLPLGCLCAGLGLSLVTVPDHYILVLILVTISGLGIAAYHPEGFKTARFFTGDRLAMGLAVFTVGGNVGLALGPLATIFIVSRFGTDYLPLMLAFSGIFLVLLLSVRSSLKHMRPLSASKETARPPAPEGAYLSMGLLVAAVVMRSWTHFGLMSYIPFYYIDHEKGDPLYAGLLVTAFLAGGAVGTLLGSPMADRFGYKRYFVLSLAISSVLFPLIFVTHGVLLVISLALVGMALISSFTSTIVMAQEILPGNLGVASGLMAGFAIGTGGIGVSLLGVIADNFGVLTALHCIGFLPVAGLLIASTITFPLIRRPVPQTT